MAISTMDHQQHITTAKDALCASVPMRQGLVTIFTGDGRGKTTAAIGTALRAAGHGLRVLVIMFMKGPDFVRGEVVAMETVANITVRSFGATGWVEPGCDHTTHQLEATKALGFAAESVAAGCYDLMVLDEVISAVTLKVLRLEDVLKFVRTKPSTLELILTGRGATNELIGLADLVTEMKNIKHPYEHGVAARAGVDY